MLFIWRLEHLYKDTIFFRSGQAFSTQEKYHDKEKQIPESSMKLVLLLFTQVYCRQIVYTAHITDDRPIPVNPVNVKAITYNFKFTRKSRRV